MKRAAIYCRVSTQAQSEQGTSLQSQLDACRRYAQREGYMVVREVEDDTSGAGLARPGLRLVRDLVEQGAADVVVVYSLDRLSRDTGDTLTLLKEFQRRNVALKSATVPIESTPEGMMLLTMLAAIAQYERTQILERTKRGKERTARNGRILGNWIVPLGYDYTPGSGMFTVNEGEAAHVRAMFTMMASGRHTCHSIGEHMTALGVRGKRGGYLDRRAVRTILRNPAYRGVHTYNRRHGRADPTEWIDIPVPALVSEDVWQRAQWQLDENRRTLTHARQHEYLLSGHVRCGFCNRAMHAETETRPHKRRRAFYRCHMRKRAAWRPRGEVCPAQAYAADIIEPLVWDALFAYMAGPMPAPPAHLDPYNHESPADTLATLDARRAALDREEDRMLAAYRAEAIDLDRLRTQMADIKRQRATIDAERERAQADAESRIDAASWQDVRDMLLSVAPDLTMQEKRHIIRTVRLQVVCRHDTLILYALPYTRHPFARLTYTHNRRIVGA